MTDKSAGKAESLSRAAIGTGALGRADDLPLIQPDCPDNEAEEQRPRNEDEMHQWNRQSNESQNGSRGKGERRALDAIPEAEAFNHHLRLSWGGAKALQRYFERSRIHQFSVTNLSFKYTDGNIYGVPCKLSITASNGSG